MQGAYIPVLIYAALVVAFPAVTLVLAKFIRPASTSFGAKLKLISGEGEATNGPIMQIGNTQTPVRFRAPPDEYMTRWFAEAPTHHCALSIGHNAALFEKVGGLMQIKHVTL